MRSALVAANGPVVAQTGDEDNVVLTAQAVTELQEPDLEQVVSPERYREAVVGWTGVVRHLLIAGGLCAMRRTTCRSRTCYPGRRRRSRICLPR